MEKRKFAAPNSPKSTKKPCLELEGASPKSSLEDDSGNEVFYDSDPETHKQEEEECDPRYVSLTKEDEDSYLAQNQRYAEMALEYYNKKNHTNYKLVEALASSAFNFLCLHCNFKAKQATTNTEDGDSSTKLFFAEFGRKTMNPDDVNRCCILKGKTTAGCSLCGHEEIKHPISSSFAWPNRRSYARRSSS